MIVEFAETVGELKKLISNMPDDTLVRVSTAFTNTTLDDVTQYIKKPIYIVNSNVLIIK